MNIVGIVFWSLVGGGLGALWATRKCNRFYMNPVWKAERDLRIAEKMVEIERNRLEVHRLLREQED